MSGSWKNLERKVAKLLGGKRILRGADFSRSAGDVEHPRFSIECKYRSRGLKLLEEALDQAREYCPGKIPLVVFKSKGRQGEIVCLELEDLVRILGGESVRTETVV